MTGVAAAVAPPEQLEEGEMVEVEEEEEEEDGQAWRAEVEERLRGVRGRGFINYFGPQRLAGRPIGEGKVGGGACAWEVGRALLRQDWDGLLRLLFAPRQGEKEVGWWWSFLLCLEGKDAWSFNRKHYNDLITSRSNAQVLRKAKARFWDEPSSDAAVKELFKRWPTTLPRERTIVQVRLTEMGEDWGLCVKRGQKEEGDLAMHLVQYLLHLLHHH